MPITIAIFLHSLPARRYQALVWLILCSLPLLCFGGEVNGQDSDLGKQFFLKGEAAIENGLFDSAGLYFNKAGEAYEKNGNWEQGFHAFYRSSHNFNWAQQYLQSIDAAEKAVQIRAKHFNTTDSLYVTGLLQLGVSWYFKGDYKQALRFYNEALTLCKNLYPNQPNEDFATCYHRIAIIYDEWGDHEKASDYMESAQAMRLKIYSEGNTRLAAGYAILAFISQGKMEYDKMIEYFQRSLQQYQRLKGSLDRIDIYIANAHNLLGNAYMEIDQNDQAYLQYDSAYMLYRSYYGSEDNNWVANSYHNLGLIKLETGEYPAALAYFQKALDIHLRILGNINYDVITTYQSIGETYLAMGDHAKSLHYFQKAIASCLIPQHVLNADSNPRLQDVVFLNYILDPLRSKAEVLAKMGNAVLENKDKDLDRKMILPELQTSLRTFQTAIQFIDSLRRGYAEGSKQVLAAEQKGLYENSMAAATQLYHFSQDPAYYELALEFMEKSKSILMLESLAETDAMRFAGIPDSLLQRERSLATELATLERDFFEVQHKGGSADSTWLVQQRLAISKKRRASEVLTQRLEKDFPNYYKLKYDLSTATVASIREHLPDEHTALVEYFIGNEQLFLFLITAQDQFVMAFPKPKKLEDQIRHMRDGILDLNFREDPMKPYLSFGNNAWALYQTLVQPVNDLLATNEAAIQVDQLIIIPDGLLGYIPFEALLTAAPSTIAPAYDKLAYLIHDYQISYQYSATLFCDIQGKGLQSQARPYLGFAPDYELTEEDINASESGMVLRNTLNPLPWAASSVTNIGNMLGGAYFVKGEATEARFKAEALHSGIIHLATHALVDDKNPLDSKFVFTADADSEEDGMLYIYELYNMTIPADLAILSACNTGYGKLIAGQGIMSLAQGFTYAGCPSMMTSLWEVTDNKSTAKIIERFFEGITAGESKEVALHQAKLDYLAEADAITANPFFWAEFVMIGDTSPIPVKQHHTLLVWIFGGLVIVVGVGILFVRKRKALAFEK